MRTVHPHQDTNASAWALDPARAFEPITPHPSRRRQTFTDATAWFCDPAFWMSHEVRRDVVALRSPGTRHRRTPRRRRSNAARCAASRGSTRAGPGEPDPDDGEPSPPTQPGAAA